MCGEACMDPTKYWIYKIFEPGLTLAIDDTPCAEQKSSHAQQGNYTVYAKTDTHGGGPISVTLDMYRPEKL